MPRRVHLREAAPGEVPGSESGQPAAACRQKAQKDVLQQNRQVHKFLTAGWHKQDFPVSFCAGFPALIGHWMRWYATLRDGLSGACIPYLKYPLTAGGDP